MNNNLQEESLELEAMKRIAALGYEAIDCFGEVFEENATLGRTTPEEVVLKTRLKAAAVKLNPHLPIEAIDNAVSAILESKGTVNRAEANQYYYNLIKNGIDVEYKDAHGITQEDKVKIIDWQNPDNNDFLITRQFKISGEMYNCRADLIIFINGLPLVFIELKASHKHLENAYNDNIKHYFTAIPRAFDYNALIIISNGTESKIGSLTSPLEHFSDWKKINNEGEEGIISLDTVIKGVLDKKNLLDIIENFILFQKTDKGLVKIIGKNHQFLGVNNGFKNIADPKIRKSQKLGVFWHTQGSGKSFSMVFLAQKVFRKLAGNWTFLIVTDREDLDKQIYGNFLDTGAVYERNVRANSKANLKKLLSEDHRYVFTMIQKFQGTELISNRNDIIVITDESHRTQYGQLAMYMRKALPNASFMAFTGTPLMGEERTKLEFGDYVSIYDFEQSVRDNATVKLYYENRRPDLQITNPDLNKAIKAVIDNAGLNEEQEEQFYKEYASMYQIITRDDRLNKIAENVVEHFMGRGHMGKAMYAAVDKATAIKMYDKVQIYWKKYQDKLKEELKSAKGNLELETVLKEKIAYMQETDMAVIVSASQNEVEECKKKGADIIKHRKRLNTENLEEKFKAVDSNLRIVFVCSMWIVGFDAKAVSTMYIDKILKEHTLMQTIARANRVFKDKNNGIIIDYIGIFTALQKALAMYGRVNANGQILDSGPATDKEDLVKLLDKSALENTLYCQQKNIDVDKIFNEKDNFKKIKMCDNAVEAILSNDKSKEEFLNNVSELKKLFTAVLPDTRAEKYAKQVIILSIISTKVNVLLRRSVSKKEIEDLAYQVGEILNKSIKISEYAITSKGNFDLSTVDFDLLQKRFDKDKKKTLIEQIKSGLRAKIQKLMNLNKSRITYLDKLEKILLTYNTNDIDLDKFFNELMAFAKELAAEEKRHIAEGLTEEELAIFDILTKPAPELTKKEIERVRKISKELLKTLKNGKLNAGWKRMQSGRAKVKVAIDDVCGRDLPEAYVDRVYTEKCRNLYIHFFDNYQSAINNTYSSM